MNYTKNDRALSIMAIFRALAFTALALSTSLAHTQRAEPQSSDNWSMRVPSQIYPVVSKPEGFGLKVTIPQSPPVNLGTLTFPLEQCVTISCPCLIRSQAKY